MFDGPITVVGPIMAERPMMTDGPMMVEDQGLRKLSPMRLRDPGQNTHMACIWVLRAQFPEPLALRPILDRVDVRPFWDRVGVRPIWDRVGVWPIWDRVGVRPILGSRGHSANMGSRGLPAFLDRVDDRPYKTSPYRTKNQPTIVAWWAVKSISRYRIGTIEVKPEMQLSIGNHRCR